MAAPIQMTAETLNATKGWPNPAAVDFSAKFDSSVNIRVPAGAVVTLNSSGKFILGVGTTNKMPMFTFQASDSPDVVNEGGDAAADKGVWVGVSPTGAVMALVAVGAYELVSTNFVTASKASLVVGAWLTSAVGLGATAGKLDVGTLGTHTVVGQVSRGVVDNGYGVDAVAFWPLLLPVYP